MELGERRKRGQALTRPELAVLLAYAKLSLYDELLDSAVPDDPYLGRELGRYFPKLLGEQFPEALQTHRLRREIIATQLANSMINRGGPSLLVRIADQTGASPDRIAAAFAARARQLPHDRAQRRDRRARRKIRGKVQLDLYAAVQDLLLDRLVWFLRNVDLTQGLAAIVEHYGAGISEVEAMLDDALSPEPWRHAWRASPHCWTPACRRARARIATCVRSRRRLTSCWSRIAPGNRSPK